MDAAEEPSGVGKFFTLAQKYIDIAEVWLAKAFAQESVLIITLGVVILFSILAQIAQYSSRARFQTSMRPAVAIVVIIIGGVALYRIFQCIDKSIDLGPWYAETWYVIWGVLKAMLFSAIFLAKAAAAHVVGAFVVGWGLYSIRATGQLDWMPLFEWMLSLVLEAPGEVMIAMYSIFLLANAICSTGYALCTES